MLLFAWFDCVYLCVGVSDGGFPWWVPGDPPGRSVSRQLQGEPANQAVVWQMFPDFPNIKLQGPVFYQCFGSGSFCPDPDCFFSRVRISKKVRIGSGKSGPEYMKNGQVNIFCLRKQFCLRRRRGRKKSFWKWFYEFIPKMEENLSFVLNIRIVSHFLKESVRLSIVRHTTKRFIYTKFVTKTFQKTSLTWKHPIYRLLGS